MFTKNNFKSLDQYFKAGERDACGAVVTGAYAQIVVNLQVMSCSESSCMATEVAAIRSN